MVVASKIRLFKLDIIPKSRRRPEEITNPGTCEEGGKLSIDLVLLMALETILMWMKISQSFEKKTRNG